jgi:hypothetical protein
VLLVAKWVRNEIISRMLPNLWFKCTQDLRLAITAEDLGTGVGG